MQRSFGVTNPEGWQMVAEVAAQWRPPVAVELFRHPEGVAAVCDPSFQDGAGAPGPVIRVAKRPMSITVEAIDSSSDDELFQLLGKELQGRISAKRGSAEFVSEIQGLPVGLRAMAATYELDVSLALDDLGWHFGNWHNKNLAEETARGLELLGATELSVIFWQAFQIAKNYWTELGAKNWMEWYHGSPFEKAVEPLTKRAWSILKDKENGIFKCWVDYARQHPEEVGAADA